MAAWPTVMRQWGRTNLIYPWSATAPTTLLTRPPIRIDAVFIMTLTVSMLCSLTTSGSADDLELKDSSLNFLACWAGFFMGWFSEFTASHITVGVLIQTKERD
jgi:hypothetical protein